MEQSLRNSLSFDCMSLDHCLSIRFAAPLIPGKTQSQDKPRSAPDIAWLTHQMVKGEEEAYRQFHDAYFNRLLGYLLVVTGDEQMAREALQLTLVRVARHAKRFDSQEAFWSWLTRLARSSVVDESRHSNRYASALDRFVLQSSIEREGQANESYSRLKELLELNLAALPLEDRLLLEQKYFEGESVRQIAQASRVSEKAVESRLVRIRQKLRDMVLSQLKHEG